MKIRDVKKEVGFDNPMLGGIRITGDTGWVADYMTNFKLLDRYFVLNYGLRDVINTDSVVVFQDDVECALYANKYTLDKLWDSLLFKYNPIYNVEEHTTETITNDNSITDDKQEGQREKVINNQYGSVTNTSNTNIGEMKQNVKHGSHNDDLHTDINSSVAPFDASNMHPKEHTVSNNHNEYGEQIVSTDNSPRVDSGTFSTGAHTDNASVVDKPVDINNTRIEELKQVLQRDREGNIGVMSAQTLITEERQIALFNFWKEFFKIIVASCCSHAIVDIRPKLEGWWD